MAKEVSREERVTGKAPVEESPSVDKNSREHHATTPVEPETETPVEPEGE